MIDEDQTQLVDENQNFSPRLQYYLSDVWNLKNNGLNYKVISIFGSQSSGKSTLLNGIFKTNFAVMRDDVRSQTTRGIWLSKAKNAPFLILDVEGTDGRERGENQEFERKSALFSIAISQVFIINMWEHSVGLYHGANMGLLKTVFEVNLTLFQKLGSPKTLLFFVIRDYVGTTPLANLEQTLRNDLRSLWLSLPKPAATEGTDFTDFFDIEVVTLPHKFLQKDNFKTEIDAIARRFYDENASGYVFRRDLSKLVPIDGFYAYVSSIWETIRTNKDLDLPTQQELLAQFRCDEMIAELFAKFLAQSDDIAAPLKFGKVVEDFKYLFENLVTEYMDLFKSRAERYNATVVEKKMAEFHENLLASVKLNYLSLLKILFKKSVHMFNVCFEKKLHEAPSTSSSAAYFMKIATDTKQMVCAGFEKMSSEAIIFNLNEEWSCNEIYAELKETIQSRIDIQKKESILESRTRVKEKFHDDITDNVSLLLDVPTESLWSRVQEIYEKLAQNSLETHASAMAGFDLSEEELEQLRSELLTYFWDQCLKKKLMEESGENAFQNRVRSVFEKYFCHDAEGLPRLWSPSDDLDGIFKDSRLKAMTVANILCNLEFTTPELSLYPKDAVQDDRSIIRMVLIPECKFLKSKAVVEKRFEATFLEAKRSLIHSHTHVPTWLIVLLLVLGWNEIVTVLTSPLYFMLVSVVAIGVFVLHHLKLLPLVQRSILSVLRQAQQNFLLYLNQMATDPKES